MFDNWRKRRKLERELKNISKHYAPKLKAAKTQDEYRDAAEPYYIDIAETRGELESIFTGKREEKPKNSDSIFPLLRTPKRTGKRYPTQVAKL